MLLVRVRRRRALVPCTHARAHAARAAPQVSIFYARDAKEVRVARRALARGGGGGGGEESDDDDADAVSIIY